MNRPNITPNLKNILNQISTYDNIPRKKAKFQVSLKLGLFDFLMVGMVKLMVIFVILRKFRRIGMEKWLAQISNSLETGFAQEFPFTLKIDGYNKQHFKVF